MTADLAFLSITELIAAFERGEVSSREATQAQLTRIDAHDDALNAFITVMAEQALAAANHTDARRRAGERGTLLGVPLAVKDLFATAGVRTTAGARVLAGSVPDETATAVQRLEDAGAVILGKTNMMEFAYGYPHPDFGETRNPWDTTRTAGGSSGGSAAAVAAGLAYGALGSDTGGSIRSPACYCGITGLKPTYGRVSRAGVVPLAWSLDHCGPMTRTARDAALIFDAIAGHDPRDPASASEPFVPTAPDVGHSVKGLRIGVIQQYVERYAQPEVRRVAEAALAVLPGLGVELVPIEPDYVPLVGPVIMPLVQAEATAYHWQTLLDRPDDYSNNTRDNLRLGATILAKDYLHAQRVRRQMQAEVDAALQTYDALIFPTQPIVAPLLGAYDMPDTGEADVLDVEIGYTGLANLTGHPAVSFSCGFTDAGLPVGLQLTGRSFDEATILAIAHAYQHATDWHTRRPAL
ncbi:MAG TPA: amidase [Thermomicrobiales bacterium]|nr:amidase [Thermomicrobiales bacterium]